jgi:enterochelin esterase-like enzyme
MRLEIQVPTWATHYISDHTDMDRRPQAVDAQRVPRFTLTLPDAVRFEYAFIDREGRVRADPWRGATGHNPWYPEVTTIWGPAYRPPTLADPPAASEAWRVARYRVPSRAFGADRRVTVLSPREVHGPLPVLMAHDGVAYLRLARAGDVAAALMAQGRACPVHWVFLEPAERRREYAWDERHIRFVHDEVRPLVAEHHPTGRGWWAVGAGLGGLAPPNLALHAPDDWAGVIAQAGAFLGSPDDPRFHGSDHSELAERLEGGAGAHLRWVLEVGTLDWLLGVNRRVRDALDGFGADLYYRERPAGHNWGAWRDSLPEMLAWALDPHAPGGCAQRLSGGAAPDRAR